MKRSYIIILTFVIVAALVFALCLRNQDESSKNDDPSGSMGGRK